MDKVKEKADSLPSTTIQLYGSNVGIVIYLSLCCSSYVGMGSNWCIGSSACCCLYLLLLLLLQMEEEVKERQDNQTAS